MYGHSLSPINMIPHTNDTRDPDTLCFPMNPKLPIENEDRLYVRVDDYLSSVIFTDGTYVWKPHIGKEVCKLSGIVKVHQLDDYTVVDIETEQGIDTMLLTVVNSQFEWKAIAHGELVFHANIRLGNRILTAVNAETNELIEFRRNGDKGNAQPMERRLRYLRHIHYYHFALSEDGCTVYYGSNFSKTVSIPVPVKTAGPTNDYNSDCYILFIGEDGYILVYYMSANGELEPIQDLTDLVYEITNGVKVFDIVSRKVLMDDGNMYWVRPYLPRPTPFTLLKSNVPMLGANKSKKSAMMT
jgi:hypothetical protein